MALTRRAFLGTLIGGVTIIAERAFAHHRPWHTKPPKPSPSPTPSPTPSPSPSPSPSPILAGAYADTYGDVY